MRPDSRLLLFLSLAGVLLVSACATPRGTGDLGIVIERAAGSVQVVETTTRTRLARVSGLGDLSHASVVYSRDARYAYVFGRDGGLTKVDMLRRRIEKRIVQAGNAVGGAISQDGRLIAVSNYDPGGVKIFTADTLELVADIPAGSGDSARRSKIVGLVDAPDRRFVFSLFDAGEIWVADMRTPRQPRLQKFSNIGKLPYDGTVTPDGRYYIAGLFGEDGLALLDLWQPDKGVRRVLDGYGRGQEPLPVFKMPHMDYWAQSGGLAYVPAVGRHEVLMIDQKNWTETARIAVAGQPVFVIARPDGRQVWVNFAPPDNDTVQVIDTLTLKVIRTLKPGKAVLHMEFTPRGENVWLSVRDENRVDVYDTETLERVTSLLADKPSGIFFTARAQRIGQ
ncbi:MAG: protein nirF [Gammaproteobacteria bacterium]|nr:protein nirF [Gammaproteobacteria bacterium]MDH3407452.1 protein nirF [Gammaproteobacteria bacterium]MDH3562323.1 protein nirF [Gammaproteobacteria bacterium]MDH5487476.1 protein nirF [Gammaproteobacteria bacterium]